MHHWFRGCWWRPVCIPTAQTLPNISKRRTRRGWLLNTVCCPRSSYQNEIPRWDSPSLPLRHSMLVNRVWKKEQNRLARDEFAPKTSACELSVLAPQRVLCIYLCSPEDPGLKSSTRSSFYFWEPCSSNQSDQVCDCMGCAVPSMFRSSCCFGMLPFVNAHFPTAHPGLIFRK